MNTFLEFSLNVLDFHNIQNKIQVMDVSWLKFVDQKRRKNLIAILQELSKYQQKDDLNFIIIGALPLLMLDYLNWIVCWDIDLLFKDKERLREFMNRPKAPDLKIVSYDDDLMTTENITSFHTAWSFDKNWFNVDYILREPVFKFYTSDTMEYQPFTQSFKFENESFNISLYLAHPWDIFIEKVISPRAEKEIDLKIDLSVDIRHIFAIYLKEKENIEFWQHILKKIKAFNCETQFKGQLVKLFAIKGEIGYGDIEISPLSVQMLS